jgi:biopolymer transport protein TolR
MGASTGNQGSSLSDINVTPLVDVMLVLLIIFMVTAPMMQQGIEVDLPTAQANALDTSDDDIVISVTRTGEVYLNDHRYPVEELGEKLKAIKMEREVKEVFLKADSRVEYGAVIRVMASIRQAGIEGLGMITEEVDISGPRGSEEGGR